MSTILPHEVNILKSAIDRGNTENIQASIDMTAAASDTNSWHDNAEYDEVIERMKLIDARYTPIVRLLARSAIGEYPSQHEKTVKLGSLAKVSFENKMYCVLVVGVKRQGDELYQKAWENEESDTELIISTIESPLGKSIVGKAPGEHSSFIVGNHEASVYIQEVDQIWITRFAKEEI